MWFWLALASAILWGIAYAITGKYVKELPATVLLTIFAVVGLCAYLPVLYFKGNMSPYVDMLKRADVLVPVLIASALFVIGNFTIYEAIRLKNVSQVNLIEISYPLFTALATWFLYKENHLTLPVIFGGLLIAAGVIVIYTFGD